MLLILGFLGLLATFGFRRWPRKVQLADAKEPVT